jgi:hypothetical protein
MYSVTVNDLKAFPQANRHDGFKEAHSWKRHLNEETAGASKKATLIATPAEVSIRNIFVPLCTTWAPIPQEHRPRQETKRQQGDQAGRFQ